jgi:hypothetical protein
LAMQEILGSSWQQPFDQYNVLFLHAASGGNQKMVAL